MTTEQSRKQLGIKIVAAMLALLVLSIGIGTHAVYADDEKDKDKGDVDCTSLLGIIPVFCTDSANSSESETAR